MADEIPPALTPEEWRAYAPPEPAPRIIDVSNAADDLLDRLGELSAVIALANAARPDDDPGKITRADVEAIYSGAGLLAATPYRDAALSLAGIAAKLAALLPPDTP